MLELKNIKKTYPSGGEDVHALKGINLQFRESEFVSILGPSGCGKTTMLNIIGGLDHCTDGDLEINGKSTKDFKDRDWDSYRNHSIGFVFQSYNLIPHQSVLANVELALTLAGVSRKERRERAKKALERVGLANQIRKRPNQMSGGQMQRVAIARAIVNDPDIILADEPTGALDTETSLQVMDILKEISKEKLVIMVTHNPDLAEKYSTRIVKMLDGLITDDSRPLSSEEYYEEWAKSRDKGKVKQKMPKMKLHTAFGLSLKNLFTKRARTILTCFAGSIGIIGIALIYSVSQGTNNYIELIQEETLSSYPITIESQTMDMSSLLSTFIGNAESVEEHENDAVYQKAMIYSFINSLTSITEHDNDLKSFKKYIDTSRADVENPLSSSINGVQYTYNVPLNVYTRNVDDKIIKSDLQDLMMEIVSSTMGIDSQALLSMSGMTSMYPSSMNNYSQMWQELLPGDNGKAISEIIPKQYDLIYGSWPENYNEIVLFLDENNEINDLTLYALGLKTEQEIEDLLIAAGKQETVEYKAEKWSYEDICSLEFTTVIPADCWYYNPETGLCEDLTATQEGLQTLYDNGIKLKITGIAKPFEGSVSSMVYGALGYTSKLTQRIIEMGNKAKTVQVQMENPDRDIFNGLLFKEAALSLSDSQKAAEFANYAETLKVSDLALIYQENFAQGPSDEEIAEVVEAKIKELTRSQIEQMFIEGSSQMAGMNSTMIQRYLKGMSDQDIRDLFDQYAATEVRAAFAQQARADYFDMSESEMADLCKKELAKCTTEDNAALYSKYIKPSSSTYDKNLRRLGCLDLETPSSINLFASVFADKDIIEEAIDKYNESVDEIQEIRYTDYVGILMSSVTTIVKAVTYVLISFVAVSLVVSSIMIGVITLISVQERTKEIGVLRSLGASKRNVSSMFNAETVIIGLVSGLIGVGLTWIFIVPINAFLFLKTSIHDLKAVLPIPVAGILVFISVILTMIAGIIPSSSASRKDPVEALRTE